MNYKIAICDDSEKDSDYVLSIVKDWAHKDNLNIQINTFSSAEALLFHYEAENDYDILLLDIEMKEMNGVELAKRIRQGNKEIQIIFITGYTDYIADGYDVEALHYILKPVHADKLLQVLERAREKLKKNEAALLVKLTDGTMRIPLYTIRYIEVRSNYVTIHADEDVTLKTTLSAIEKDLDESFCRIGRSFIVNLRSIRRITRNEALLSDGSSIPLPRGMYEPLNRALIHYF